MKSLLLPPFSQILLLIVAWLLRNRLPRLARVGFWAAVLSLWFLATPMFSSYMASTLEQDKPLQPNQIIDIPADVIVILSGAQNERASEFGEPVSEPDPLSRIRYGVFLHRKIGIPILLSGGSVRGDEERSLAETMGFDLLNGFGVKAQWLEQKSRTTAENGRYSYSILEPINKTSILLVTSSLHMKRARLSFEQSGFKVYPAPTNFIGQSPRTITSFLPTAKSLNLSSQAIHEWLGYWFYRLIEFS